MSILTVQIYKNGRTFYKCLILKENIRMKSKKFLLMIVSVGIAAGFMSGCASHPNQTAPVSSCTAPSFCKTPVRVKIKRVAVSECPKRVKTVVYKGVCDHCDNFPVSVRENSCCVPGGCK